MKMLFFIDGDNNITTGLNGIQHLTEEDTVLVFHSQGMALSKIRARCATSRAKVSFIESVKDGKNSVDFQIVAELGVRIGKNEVQFAYIISQDQGYVPSITMLKKCYGDLFCEIGLADSIESCLNLTFLLRTRTRLELYTSLCREYGEAKGDLVFKHLKELFEMPEVNYAPAAAPKEEPLPAPAEEAAEEPAPETVTAEIEEPVPAEEEKEPEPAPAPVASEERKPEPMEEPIPAEPKEAKEEPAETPAPVIPEAVKPEPSAVPAPAPAEETKEEPKPEPKAEPKPFMTAPKTFVVASGAVIPGGAISSSEKKEPAETVKAEEPKPAEAEAPKPAEAKPVKKTQAKKPAAKAAPKPEAKPAEKPAAEPVKTEEKAESKEAAPEKPAKTSRRRSSAKKKADEGPAPAAEPAPVKEADKPAEAPKAEEPAPETAAKDAPVSDAAPAVRNHTMKLYAAPFEKILAGKKSVEIRCNDTKRQKLRVGDTITFEKQTNEGGTLTVRVTSLDTYPTFEELIEAKGLTVLGCEPEDTPESCLKKLLRIYGKRQVQTYGAVAIGIELIP